MGAIVTVSMVIVSKEGSSVNVNLPVKSSMGLIITLELLVSAVVSEVSGGGAVVTDGSVVAVGGCVVVTGGCAVVSEVTGDSAGVVSGTVVSAGASVSVGAVSGAFVVSSDGCCSFCVVSASPLSVSEDSVKLFSVCLLSLSFELQPAKEKHIRHANNTLIILFT